MLQRSRTKYMYGNTFFRTQRERTKSIADQTLGTLNWNNISGFANDGANGNFVTVTGFTNTSVLEISVPANTFWEANGGFLLIYTSPTSNPVDVTNSNTITVDPSVTATSYYTIRPGDIVSFNAYCDIAIGPLTFTVRNYFGSKATIDTFTVTFT